jgi:hypothetical protein
MVFLVNIEVKSVDLDKLFSFRISFVEVTSLDTDIESLVNFEPSYVNKSTSSVYFYFLSKALTALWCILFIELRVSMPSANVSAHTEAILSQIEVTDGCRPSGEKLLGRYFPALVNRR